MITWTLALIGYFVLLTIGIAFATAPLWLGDLSDHAVHGDRLDGKTAQQRKHDQGLSARVGRETQGRDSRPTTQAPERNAH